VPSGIIVISVVTVGSAVQINRSCLSSVSTLITCRGYPDTRQVAVQKDPKHCTISLRHESSFANSAPKKPFCVQPAEAIVRVVEQFF
jgi:hypothetical protein